MTSLVLGWLVFNALVAALLSSQAKPLVMLVAGLVIMGLWLVWSGLFWFLVAPLVMSRAALRRLGLLEAA